MEVIQGTIRLVSGLEGGDSGVCVAKEKLSKIGWEPIAVYWLSCSEQHSSVHGSALTVAAVLEDTASSERIEVSHATTVALLSHAAQHSPANPKAATVIIDRPQQPMITGVNLRCLRKPGTNADNAMKKQPTAIHL